jgi:murein DD-endopeptidase MepM/ murein hydrolase activator NlpD
VTLKLPPGNVTTFRPGSQNPYNIPWSNVSRYEPAFSNAAKEFGVDVYLIIAVAILESGSLQSGERWDNYPEDGPSVGIMQVKPKVWQWLVPTADAYTPVGNIRLGTAALDWAIVDTGSWQKAIVTHYFPDDDPNGTTQNMYVQTITALMNEMSAEETPLPTDLIALVMGTPNYSLTFDWAAPESGNIYEYGRGHGLNGHQHTGLDVGATFDAPLFAAFAGTVVCGATGWGNGAWGTGCSSFGDPMGGGAGRVEILHTDGIRSLIYGHVHDSLVSPGALVTAGQQIASVGGMNGWHVHLEARKKRGTSGDYTIHDPRALFADITGSPPKAPRANVPQPEEFDRTWTVTVTENGVPVLQRADPNASPVAEPLQKGEQFEAAYLTLSDATGKPYWVSKARGRIPAEGTNLAEVLGIKGGEKPDLTPIRHLLGELESEVSLRVDDIVDRLTEVSA